MMMNGVVVSSRVYVCVCVYMFVAQLLLQHVKKFTSICKRSEI